MDSFGNKILRIAIQDKLQAKLGGVGGGPENQIQAFLWRKQVSWEGCYKLKVSWSKLRI